MRKRAVKRGLPPRAPGRARALSGLAALLFAIASLGCGGGAFYARSTPCLSGPTPHVGRPVPDEDFALMRREYARAGRGNTVVGAHILEGLPRIFPDVSDLAPEPACSVELVNRMTAELLPAPVGFSRRTIARIRSIGSVMDTNDVMEAKAHALMRLVDLGEGRLPAYRLLPDETGLPPPKALLKYLALAELSRSNVYANVPDARRFLERRMRAPRDDREALLLVYPARQEMEDSLWGHPASPSSQAPGALLHVFIEDAGRRLDRGPDRLSLEVVLSRLWPIGEYAERFGLEKPARALVDRILRVRGRVPLTRGIEGGAPDLAVAAVSARADLDRHPVHIEIPGPMPRPHRAVYDAFAGLLSTPRERVKIDAARARMRQLAPELASLRYAPARCYVVAEQAAWVPEADAPALFDGMTAPIFDKSGRVRFGEEMLCRARTALSMDAVDAARRVGLALRLLGAGPGQILPFDMSAVEHHAALVHFAGKDQVAGVAAAAIADHLDWVDSSPGLRAWLGHALADSVAPRQHSLSGMPEAGLQAAYERLVAFDLARRRGDEARAVLTAWIDAVRAAANRTHSSIYPMELMMRRLYALGELAASVGVETEVRTLLDELQRGRHGIALARPLAVAAYLLAEGTRQGVRGSSRGSRQSRCTASQDNPRPAFAPTRSSW